MKQAQHDEPAASPFERFQQLARKLFAVPKRELDKKLAKYEAQKTKRRKQAKR